MDIVVITLIALSLSFDTFAVSISIGLFDTTIIFFRAVGFAMVMTFFQSLMPFLGWLAGIKVEKFINNYDHWLAFCLLLILGIKMIYESIRKNNGDNKYINKNYLSLQNIIWLGIATSIDAFIVGLSFGFLKFDIFLSILIIGFVTFIASMLGMLLGKKIGDRFGKKMEIAGGMILIVIGIKILLSHIFNL
jgi:putative Mn2+ efflux pump MntP